SSRLALRAPRPPRCSRYFRRAARVLCLVVSSSARVYAGGFELAEQSPKGVATSGAQTAVADDASAVYYNPAGLAFQTGLSALVGGNLIVADTDVTLAGTKVADISHVSVAPTIYVGQRIGKHLAVGIGAFSNFGEHFSYGPNWAGRFSGTLVDVTTATINPSV